MLRSCFLVSLLISAPILGACEAADSAQGVVAEAPDGTMPDGAASDADSGLTGIVVPDTAGGDTAGGDTAGPGAGDVAEPEPDAEPGPDMVEQADATSAPDSDGGGAQEAACFDLCTMMFKGDEQAACGFETIESWGFPVAAVCPGEPGSVFGEPWGGPLGHPQPSIPNRAGSATHIL